MNSFFLSRWNEALQAWVAVPEISRTQGKARSAVPGHPLAAASQPARRRFRWTAVMSVVAALGAVPAAAQNLLIGTAGEAGTAVGIGGSGGAGGIGGGGGGGSGGGGAGGGGGGYGAGGGAAGFVYGSNSGGAGGAAADGAGANAGSDSAGLGGAGNTGDREDAR